jgi:cation diffusion facilitator family transporter
MSCCEQSQSFEGLTPGYKRALWAVIAINGVMFVVEMLAGFASGSQALKADALDFAGDTATYAISLAVLGASLKLRAKASLFKGASLAALAAFILITTAQRVFGGEPPGAQTMSLIGFLALLANMVSVLILLRWRNGDSNVRSVWLCSRNDAIGNVGVIIAGFVVGVTGAAWPDLLVAGLLATLFMRSSISIIRQALGELRHVAASECDGDKAALTASSEIYSTPAGQGAPDDGSIKSASDAIDTR